MRKSIIGVCLSIVLLLSITGMAFAYTTVVSYSIEGVELDMGPLNIKPTALVILYGKPGDVVEQLKPSPGMFDYFEPEADFFFNYDPTLGTSIVFRPEDDATLDDPDHIVGIVLFEETAYDDVDVTLMSGLEFSDVGDPIYIDSDDTLIVLTANGEYRKIGNLSKKGSHVVIDISENPTPEPSTFILFGVGLLGLCWRLKARKKIMQHIKNSMLLCFMKGGRQIILFIAIASMLVTFIPHPTHAQEAKPLYRLYIGEVAGGCGSDTNCWSNHLDSKNANEIGTSQGRLGWVLDTQIPGTKPLYQIYRSHDTSGRDIKDDHATSDDLSEVTSGSIDGGVLGYVYTTQVPGTVPLYRKYRQYWYTIWGGTNLLHTDHITTTNSSEGNSDGWVYERVLGYILSTPNIPTVCEIATGVSQIECEALVDVYNNSGGNNWTNHTGWLQTTTPCNWYGVSCNNGNVTEISLHNNGLNGSIPSTIGDLTELTDLNFSNNQLSGSIPAEIGKLVNLQRLYLANNQLSSSLPSEIGNLVNLQQLYLWANQLTGQIPPEIGNLSSIQQLYLDNNQLSGTIPDEIANLPNVRELSLRINQLSGKVPIEIANLVTLQKLYLEENLLSGALPQNLTQLSSLQEFRYNDTGLCEPLITDFRNWLAGVPDVQGTRPCTLADDLLAYYPFEGNAHDESGNGHHATEYDGVGYGANILGQVAEFNGLGYIEVADTTDFRFSNDSVTYTAWVTIPDNADTYKPFIVLEDSDSEPAIDVGKARSGDADGRIYLHLQGNVETEALSTDDGGVLPKGRWLHVAGVVDYEQHELTLYINGDLQQTVALTGNYDLSQAADLKLRIGGFNHADPGKHNGMMDEVRIYHRVLAGEEAQKLYDEKKKYFVCDRVTEISKPECEALVTLYATTNGDNWKERTNWLETDTPCSWFGVTCDSNHVVEVTLPKNQLHGPLPAKISQLSSLEKLYLEDNQLSGIIPADLGLLTNLQQLSLADNRLTGEIPSTLGDLTNLQWLLLGGNHLNGSIPLELGQLTNLEQLYLEANQFSGPIPTELGNLKNLFHLYLWGNQLSGPIPDSFGNLVQLKRLYLGGNQLTGAIPEQLGHLPELEYLELQMNKLEGSIPESFAHLTNLKELYLYENKLSGLIPPQIGSLSKLQVLDLYSNQLNGSIPPELGQLRDLRYLDFYNNEFSGSLPVEFGELVNLEELYLNYTSLRGPLPETLMNLKELQRLFFNDTAICEPDTPDFQTWLRDTVAIVERTGNPCSFCDSVTDVPRNECNALEVLYHNTAGENWSNVSGWLATSTACSWFGVTCNGDNQVSGLALPANNLAGSLPSELIKLDALETLDLSNNALNGSIPAAFAHLINLRELRLDGNQLEGLIPHEFGYMSNLEIIALEDNLLNGTIPAKLGYLQNLTSLTLGANALNGPIPSELSKLGNLQTLELADNASLTGSLPLNFQQLPLQEFSFVNTDLCEPQDTDFQNWLGAIPTIQRTATACASTTFTIRTHAGQGGSISPAGTTPVAFGADLAVMIRPDSNYTIADVQIDNVPVGREVLIKDSLDERLWHYNFGNVQESHQIEVTFTDALDFFNFVQFGGSWEDINKTFKRGDQDEAYCWAAAASNILEWAAWGNILAEDNTRVDDAQKVFENFKKHWTPGGGLMNYGWEWWLDGPPPDLPQNPDWSQLEDRSGEYWAAYEFPEWFDCSADGYKVMNEIVYFLRHGYGVAITLYDGSKYYHAMTAWGYQYTASGDILGIWVTDSSDFMEYTTPTLRLLPLRFNTENSFWYFSGGEYDGWNLTGGVALKIRQDFPTEPGLIAHWTFDEAEGNIVKDVTGNGHHGIARNHSGTPWQRVVGLQGGALDLTNGENYVAIPDDGALSITGPMTIEARVQLGALSDGEIIFKTSTTDANEDNYVLVFKAGGFGFARENSADDEDRTVWSTTQQLAVGEWYHVVGVYDGQQSYIYFNGVLEGSLNTGAFTPYTGPADLVFGTNFFSPHGTNTNWSNLVLDDVRVYNRALSAAEISAHSKVLHTITATTSPYGAISPEGKVNVERGQDFTFTIAPGPNRKLQELLVDGVDKKADCIETTPGVFEYTFANVSANHAIHAHFLETAETVVISAAAEGPGNVSPAGDVKLLQHSNQTFTFTPELGYRIATVIVDGKHRGPSRTYTFYDVTENHELSALFIDKNEMLAIVIKKCVRIDDAGNEEEIPCDESVNAAIYVDDQLVCDIDCDMFVGTFSKDRPLYLDSEPTEGNIIVRWETVYGTWLDDGVYFTENDAVVNPVVGNSHGGNSHGGNSHGGNSHGGNSHGGNSHGGNSHGGNSHGGNSHG